MGEFIKGVQFVSRRADGTQRISKGLCLRESEQANAIAHKAAQLLTDDSPRSAEYQQIWCDVKAAALDVLLEDINFSDRSKEVD